MFGSKKAAALLAAALTLFSASSCADKSVPLDVGELEVTFFDVGKADSIILRAEDSTVIIDCGEKGDGKEMVSYLEENDVDTVDYLIITHYDKDHVGGAAKVINKLDVKNVLAPDYEEKSEEMDKYNKALAAKNKKFPKGCFALGRHIMTCCVEDIQYCWCVAEWDADFEPKQPKHWVNVQVKVEVRKHKLYKGAGPVLKVVSLADAAPPEKEVATFY